MYAKILLMTAVLLSGQVYAQSATPTTTPVVKTKAKKKKKAATAAAITPVETVAATTTAPVAEVKKTEVKPVVAVKADETKMDVVKYMKEHFSASYHGEFYLQRRMDDYLAALPHPNEKDKDIQDIKIMHNPTIIYKPTKDWQFLSTAEFKYADQDGIATYPNTFYRALFTLTRKNILEEKVHGVQLDAGIGRRQFNTGVTALPSYGNDRVFTTVTKNFGKHSASFFAQYLFNDYKKTGATTWKHSLELIPSLTLQLTDKLSYLFNDDIVLNTSKLNTKHDISMSHEMNVGYVNYQWTDKINTYYQLKWYHTDGFAEPRNNDEWFEHYVGIGYAFTPKATLTFEVGNEIVHSSDRRDFFSQKAKYPELAFYLDLAL